MTPRTIKVYSDYKSPYAYLAKDPAYHDRVFELFWKRELDIENPDALARVLAQCGADTKDFPAFLDSEGRRELQKIQQEAEAAGVFGVPSYLLEDGDLYWGREHLP